MAEPTSLSFTSAWDLRQRRWFRKLARAIARSDHLENFETLTDSLPAMDAQADSLALAAGRVLHDLAAQGWSVNVTKKQVLVQPPEPSTDSSSEKARVRAQELLKRDAQLRQPAVERWVARMERSVVFDARPVSIRSVIRDGPSLADALHGCDPSEPLSLVQAMDPYVQVVTDGQRCEHTGLRLVDIWRYFRHGWSNQYVSTPGRTMMMLVRDAAHPGHPVIGIAALGSAVVQIAERDRWLGWDTESFMAAVAAKPTRKMAQWFVTRLNELTNEIYVQDLVEDAILSPAVLREPNAHAIAALRTDARERRSEHQRLSSQRLLKATHADVGWDERARTDLYRSKRSGLVADLLGARIALRELVDEPTASALAAALETRTGRRSLERILRRTRAERVGNVIADLTVCGAVPPYAPLAAGKLVAMLAVGPTALRSYNARYRDSVSEIASSMAGRPMTRETRLGFIGTTSLYGAGSSQYNRLWMPSSAVGGPSDGRIAFVRIGRSRAYGSSHFSEQSVHLLSQITGQARRGARVNSIFGEGVNPKLRKIRNGLGVLGWSTDDLLRHGRERVIYGVPVVRNLENYLIGVDKRPAYLCDLKLRDDSEAISRWWFARWAAKRMQSHDVIAKIRSETIADGTHGALLPRSDTELRLFDGLGPR